MCPWLTELICVALVFHTGLSDSSAYDSFTAKPVFQVVPFDCVSLGTVAEYTECAMYTVSTQETLREPMNL